MQVSQTHVFTQKDKITAVMKKFYKPIGLKNIIFDMFLMLTFPADEIEESEGLIDIYLISKSRFTSFIHVQT